MAKRNRETLKSYFRRGCMPKEDHFSDLIDSMLNLVDDPHPIPPVPPVPPLPPLPPGPEPPKPKPSKVVWIEVPADGKWHSLTDWSDSCRCYSLVAGCGSTKADRFALIHAVAMHCLGYTRKIKYIRSWYLFFPSKLKLRWYSKGNAWSLQIRTRHNYGEGIPVCVKLTELWGDEDMDWMLQKK